MAVSGKRISIKDCERVVRLHKYGRSLREISRLESVSVPTVKKILRKMLTSFTLSELDKA